ncbi:hypothetical protein BKA70DRAFT_1139716 [Coprinopsis sp. MPI-PUGE-AT-0042]|nr:hypothetical protein BKA70DRAFT_1139716 [Coprinopsis sp. MPI-PUGE-AT-0042]
MSTPAARDEETGNAGPTQNVVPQRSSIPSFLFLSLLLFMLTSHNGDEFLARHQHQDALKALTWQLSNYTAWMNGTESNFTVPERDSAVGPLLDAFNVQGHELNPSESSYYLNITGFLHGNSQFYNLSSPVTLNDTLPWKSLAEKYTEGLNVTRAGEMWGEWNWNASTRAALSVVEKKPLGMDEKPVTESDLALVHGRIELTDKETEEDLRFDFEGIHFLSKGSIYGFAEPPGGRIDIRLLPSIVPADARNETAGVIAPELKARITKLKNLIDAGVSELESTSDETPKTTCPFIFVGHIDPTNVPQFLMQELEDELQNPTGISTIRQPKLSLNGIFISKECGIMYTIDDTEGLRSRSFFRKVTTYAGLSALGYLMILVLFSRQLERSRNPSGISRVSRWTFLSQATMDSVSFAGHITFAILAEGRPSMSLIAPAFLACILFVQEAQFFALINQVQGVERTYTAPTPPPAAANTGASDGSSSDSATPRATPPPPAPPQPAPAATQPSPPQPGFWGFLRFFIQHVRSDPQAQLWIGMFIFLALIVQVILSPTLTVLFVGATYSSIWLPQIVRSARRNRESGLAKEYIVGVTLIRLASAMYFLQCPKNILEVSTRPWAPFFAFTVVLQASVLMLQDTFGPAFFLPERFRASTGWDYHPPLGSLMKGSNGDVESRFGAGKEVSETGEETLGDCAICMEGIHVEGMLRRSKKSMDGRGEGDEKKGLLAGDDSLVGSGSVRSPGMFEGGLRRTRSGLMNSKARKNYSLAPCHHLFHTECLEKWLAIKNICPQCRRPLPPL